MRHSHQPAAARDHTVRQGVMRRYYDDDSTGGVITGNPAPYPVLPRMWDLLSTTSTEALSRSATTGMSVVISMYISGAMRSLQVVVPLISGIFDIPTALLAPVAVVSPASVVDLARNVFGLNISETADVFRVSRPTIYQWLKLEDMEQVRSREDRERIKAVYQAAQLWQQYPLLKGRWLQAILPSGTTALDILKAQKIDPDALRAAYTTLAAGTGMRRKEEGERAQQAISKLAEAFSQLATDGKARKGMP